MKGFTLIELLFVIAIIGILSSVAYPSYQDSVKRSRRSEAKVVLIGLAQQSERYFSEHDTYNGLSAHLNLPAYTESGYYQINITVPDPKTNSGYLLKAVAQKSQAKLDKECPVFTYNDLGQKGILGRPNNSKQSLECWRS